MDGRQQEVAESASIFEEEDGEYRDHKEQPGLLGDVGHAQADALRQLRDLIAVADQERLRQVSGLGVPAVLGAQLLRDLTGTQLGEKQGERLPSLAPSRVTFGPTTTKNTTTSTSSIR